MRLDHVAYRVKDRDKTAQFFIDAFGYTIQKPFQIVFNDGTKAECIALEPPERKIPHLPWTHKVISLNHLKDELIEYHMAPEIFVSDGKPGSIVGDWVAARNGIGGIHHIAYQVDDVESIMREWQSKGYAEFTSDKPMSCPGLVQVFTKPSELTGVIYEFIKREEFGFCQDNVRQLMESTKGM